MSKRLRIKLRETDVIASAYEAGRAAGYAEGRAEAIEEHAIAHDPYIIGLDHMSSRLLTVLTIKQRQYPNVQSLSEALKSLKKASNTMLADARDSKAKAVKLTPQQE